MSDKKYDLTNPREASEYLCQVIPQLTGGTVGDGIRIAKALQTISDALKPQEQPKAE